MRAAVAQARDEIEAEADRVIAPQEKARLARLLDEHEEGQRRKAADVARVTEALARGEKPDPNDPADRAAVEAHFESIAGAVAELPPEDRATAEDLYIQQTGVLPTPVKNVLLGGLLSSDPAAQVAAAQRLAKFEDTAPAVNEGVPQALRARARTLAAFALPGLTPARVVELARESFAVEDLQQDLNQQISQPAAATQVAQAGEGSAIPQVKNPNSKFWDDVITRLLKREKGFNPADPSNRGIKDETLEEFLKRQGKPPRNRRELMKKLRNLTENEARQIYRELFIRAPKVMDIPDERLAEQVFDAGIMHGSKKAGQLLQDSLHQVLGIDLREPDPTKGGKLTYDGIIGPKTRAALARATREGRIVEVNDRMVDNRLQFMKGLPNFKVNPGWVPRAESFRIVPTKP